MEIQMSVSMRFIGTAPHVYTHCLWLLAATMAMLTSFEETVWPEKILTIWTSQKFADLGLCTQLVNPPQKPGRHLRFQSPCHRQKVRLGD